METSRTKQDLPLPYLLGIIAFSLVGLYFLGHFDPVPDQTADADSTYVYYGPEGETVPIPGAVPADRAAALDALAEADYFGAYAAGPRGREGVYTGAWTPDLAREQALALCGAGCRVVAERLPLHRDPDRAEAVATPAMARNLAIRWPFTDDFIAVGGAGAWGQRTDSGRHGTARAKRRAAEHCEARRAAEPVADPTLTPPCTVHRLTDIIDARPKPELYPAAYTLDLTPLAPVAETRNTAVPGADHQGLLGRHGGHQPRRLYGARASNGATSTDNVHQAGWPEAGAAIALTKCEAKRRPGEAACVVTHTRQPDPPVPPGHLGVTPALYKSFLAWERTDGAGAFAISPYGVWGFSYGMEDTQAAIQKAADWCWYYTRREWEYRQVDRAFLDPGVACRVVAVRG